ncbi:pore-forming ESAT-6 family protein [Streptomyces sp. NBC_00236]|uniref:pore-forming ESAT-6 family protein n=1 Tax=unclassified Streptomyces TaxID=2593676 RepID=UPI002E29B8B6|nr:pore-forming ESAT-6 family protein [Streptomyces sp. NBC_00236]
MAGNAGDTDRRAYDTGASTEVQGNIQGVIAQLELVITARDTQVKAAMSDFAADGVADEYHGKELRWNTTSQEVRNIIQLLRSTLEKNDGTAQQTLARAKAAVDNIG